MEKTHHDRGNESKDDLKRLLQERQLIAYEIHDGLAQQLAAAKMQWENFGRLFGMQNPQAEQAYQTGLELMEQCLAETRRLIGGLRLPTLDLGVVPALNDFLGPIKSSHQTAIELASNFDEHQRFEPLLENAIFRIVQESVNNALQHSKSDRIHIHLQYRPELLRIEVQDWGIGFVSGDVREGSYGLEGIRKRASVLGGVANITSEPGQGTLITAEFPLVRENETSQ